MYLFSEPFSIFTIAMLFVLGLSLVEILLFVFGFSISKVFNADMNMDVDHDMHLHLEHDISLEHDVDVHLGDLNFSVVRTHFVGCCLLTFFKFYISILIFEYFEVSFHNNLKKWIYQ